MSQQLPLLQVSSVDAFMRHDEAEGTINDKGPPPNGPGLQPVSPVDIGGRCPPVDKDHSVTETLTPSDRLANLGDLLHAEGIEGSARLAPARVALDLDSLARHKNIVAIEESLRILSDMGAGEAAAPQRFHHETLNFLADVEAALAVLGVPV